jgi:hypothetical protein
MGESNTIVINGKINGKLTDFTVDQIIERLDPQHWIVKYNSRSLDGQEQVLYLKEIKNQSESHKYKINLYQEQRDCFSYFVEGVSKDGVEFIETFLDQLNFSEHS